LVAALISLVLLGDSITHHGVSGPPGPSFATLLADALGDDYAVSNIGCDGSSALDWRPTLGAAPCGADFARPNLYLGRARPELPADLVAVLLGTNDATGAFEPAPVDPPQYAAAIAELASALLADGAARVLLMAPPPIPSHPGAMIRLSQYRLAIDAICSAPDDAIMCGPDLFTLLGDADFSAGDAHPNAQGHARIAEALLDAIHALPDALPVPEPGSAPLVAFGLAALGVQRRLTASGFPRTVAARVRKTG
jgi:lysophospholipase L1-like esterase